MTTTENEVLPMISDNSKTGDRVRFFDEHQKTYRSGVVFSSEWSSFFNATYFVVTCDDTGGSIRVLAPYKIDRREY